MGCCCCHENAAQEQQADPRHNEEGEQREVSFTHPPGEPMEIFGRDKYRFQESPEIEALFSEHDLPPEAQAIHGSYRKVKQRCVVLRESLQALARQLDGSVDSTEIATCLGMLRQAAGPEADIQLVYECGVPRIVIEGAERCSNTEDRLLAHRHLNTLLTNSFEIVQDTHQVVTAINNSLEVLLVNIKDRKDMELHRRLCQVPPWIYSVSTQAKQLLNDINAAKPYLQPQLAID